ncbi:hypothetical protein SynA1528_01856 [Synechococcus sp. A15-28]|nr:hypothetical protein SynA1528_01856 [Synechococcus sp. A15-28]
MCCRISEGSPISFQRCAKKLLNRALGDVVIGWMDASDLSQARRQAQCVVIST